MSEQDEIRDFLNSYEWEDFLFGKDPLDKLSDSDLQERADLARSLGKFVIAQFFYNEIIRRNDKNEQAQVGLILCQQGITQAEFVPEDKEDFFDAVSSKLKRSKYTEEIRFPYVEYQKRKTEEAYQAAVSKFEQKEYSYSLISEFKALHLYKDSQEYIQRIEAELKKKDNKKKRKETILKIVGAIICLSALLFPLLFLVKCDGTKIKNLSLTVTQIKQVTVSKNYCSNCPGIELAVIFENKGKTNISSYGGYFTIRNTKTDQELKFYVNGSVGANSKTSSTSYISVDLSDEYDHTRLGKNIDTIYNGQLKDFDITFECTWISANGETDYYKKNNIIKVNT